MDACVKAGVSRTENKAHRLSTNFDFVGDHGAFSVSYGFDFGNGEAAVVQIGESALQSLVQFVLQSGSLLGWGEDASVNAVLLSMAIIGEEHELDLIGRRR